MALEKLCLAGMSPARLWNAGASTEIAAALVYALRFVAHCWASSDANPSERARAFFAVTRWRYSGSTKSRAFLQDDTSESIGAHSAWARIRSFQRTIDVGRGGRRTDGAGQVDFLQSIPADQQLEILSGSRRARVLRSESTKPTSPSAAASPDRCLRDRMAISSPVGTTLRTASRYFACIHMYWPDLRDLQVCCALKASQA